MKIRAPFTRALALGEQSTHAVVQDRIPIALARALDAEFRFAHRAFCVRTAAAYSSNARVRGGAEPFAFATHLFLFLLLGFGFFLAASFSLAIRGTRHC